MTYTAQFRWTSSSRTHTGLVRTINEDACIEQPERGLWAVADGMGGHACGDFASRSVIESLSKLPAPDSLVQYMADVRNQMQAVNRQLCAEANFRDVTIIGSTVVVLLAYERECGYLWAGDSRIYLYRNGCLNLLTRDHSQIEELVSLGTLTSEEAMHHPARNMITRAVGANDTLDLDEGRLAVNNGDIFLLCSDGLTNEVSEQEICSALLHGDCEQASATLIDMALKHGGRDNISVVVVRVEDLDSDEKTVLNPAL